MNAQNIFNNIKGKLDKNAIIKIAGVAAVLIVVGFVAFNFSNYGGVKVISAQKAGQKAVDFINKNLITPGQGQASFLSAAQESGLYKVKFSYQEQENEIYVTRDGKYLFPKLQGIPIDLDQKTEEASQQNTQQTAQTCDEVKKAEKPALNAFVVSACPYGLQMQRVLAEAVKNIPSLAANITVRYISSNNNGTFTSMHGDAEYKENLRQICLREETDKYWSYVSCYIKKGDANSCLASTGVDKAKLNSCMSEESRGLKYIKDDFALQQKFNVSGSPTLILNDETASEYNFGGRTAEALKTLLCCGFGTKPDFCSTTLSNEAAATGYSETYSSGSASNSNSASGCQQ